ncbi:hypothetical protein CONPUDRAFT_86262 [Coniophora puteana RWD-64-598 SS2]|uniref:P-loop containing nucleoside triphosphate hydrolase protein n=1 Tax=Coniophora puteana (strain RWD-64-598) TaxID=741705 RepID=A0A5M3N4L9_CONPW|nr:uncharacterized protein CONPUDRAFT_86262 [Coniophora puteana RWD-64-598 SS2]EIW86246.1 hypothetical protein CONPUDRAFT_86262 [Coniophora puteana RWD-64-598 SS2]
MQRLLQQLATLQKAYFPATRPIQRTPGGMDIVLNGFPGTGKCTILEQLKALLPADDTSPLLLHNHLLIDPAAALYPDRSEDHHMLRRRIREVVFPCIRRLVEEGHIVLMTACLAADDARDAAFFQEHLGLVRGTGVPLYWITAYCEQTRLMQRVQSHGRVHSGKTKLTDPSTLQKLVDTHRLIEPEESDVDSSTKLVVRSLDVNGEIDESVDRLMAIVGLPRRVSAG